MKKFIKNIFYFFTIIIIVAFPLDFYLTHYHFKNWNNVSQFQKDFWVMKQANIKLNIGVLGTSRAFHIINPLSIQEDSPHSKIMNFGTDGTSHADHYLYLHQLISNGVQLDTLLLEVDEFTLSGWLTNTVPFKDYIFALKFNEEPYKQAYRDYFDRKKYYFWKLPLVRFVEYNTHYNLNPFKNTKEDRFKESQGFKDAFSSGFKRNFEKDSLELKIHPFDILYLNKTIELAKNNEMEVILFTAPVEENFILKEINRERSINKIKEIATQNDILYYDFSNLNEFRDTSYFSDYTHLNLKGANKFSKYFYKQIK